MLSQSFYMTMRDWFKQPNESYTERRKRIDVLLDLRISEQREGERLTVQQISDCCGASRQSIREDLRSAIEKFKDGINLQDLPADFINLKDLPADLCNL